MFAILSRFHLLAAAYAGGHYGKSLFWYMTELLFGFYLAEIYGLKPDTIGGLLAAFLLWDAISDPLLGLTLARFSVSTRGLLRAQLVGACLSAITFWLVFLKPPLSDTRLTIYALLVGLAFRTAYTIFDVSQNTLLPRLSSTQNERLVLSALRTGGSAAASLSIAFASALILANEATTAQADGFAVAAGLILCVTLLTSVVLSRVALGGKDLEASARQHPGQALCTIFRDQELVRTFGAVFCLSIGWPLFGKLVPFFAEYVRGTPSATGAVLTTMTIAALASQPVWVLAGRNVPRGSVLLIALAVMIAGTLVFGLAADTRGSMSLLGIVLMAAANSAISLLTWAKLADRLSSLKPTGVNDVLAFGVFTFASKLALSLGGLILGTTLVYVGYQTGLPLAHKGQRDLALAMATAPTIAAVLAVLCLTVSAPRRRRVKSKTMKS